MQLEFVRPYASLAEPPVAGEISNFVVLSGPNGSGKSQLLAAIHQNAIAVHGLKRAYGDGAPVVRIFRPNEMLLTLPEPMKPTALDEIWVSSYRAYTEVLREVSAGGTAQGHEENFVLNRMLGHGVDVIAQRTGKSLLELAADDFRLNAPIMQNVDPFAVSLVNLFLTYRRREDRNRSLRMQQEDGEEPDGEPLTPARFREVNGPPPWDLMNGVLESIRMPYRFARPKILDQNLDYEPRLTDIETGVEVRVQELSDGEKVLLAVVTYLYTQLHLNESVQVPDIVLLDEPDSHLHPSMVKTLLDTISQVFVDAYHARVILTTHSPTTVALAPESSLYVMRRNASPRIIKATPDEALGSLLVGVPHISVSSTNRRQVFVEAPDDQQCYQGLWTILQPTIDTTLSLEFVPSGAGGSGNRYEAEQLVESLRGNGVKVRGLVDRDAGDKPIPDGVLINPNRYAIENLLLDPVAIAVLLLRYRKIDPVAILGHDVQHYNLSAEDAQVMVDHVLQRVRDKVGAVKMSSTDDGSTTDVEYDSGATISLPSYVLNVKGHDWENYFVNPTFPELQGPRNDYAGNLKMAVVDLAYRDSPQWIPRDVRTLFVELVTDD
ncbi:ATP-binding protein [Mycolicibacterium hodleri]|nr:ATP-binding protein [Mycolicibacterium hodleri]